MTQRREDPPLFFPRLRPRGIQTSEDIALSNQRGRSSLVKIKITQLGSGTDPQEIASTLGLAYIRLVRVRIVNETTAGKHYVELYFSDGTSPEANLLAAQTASEQVVDILSVPDLGEDATRTYGIGQGPRSHAIDQDLYARFRVDPGGSNHWAIVEYTEEK